jgi:hypothetical protein
MPARGQIATRRRSKSSRFGNGSRVAPPPASLQSFQVGATRICVQEGRDPVPLRLLLLLHRHAAHSWSKSRAFTRQRRARHSTSTVGAPPGAMLFCTARTSISSSRPFDRLRTGRTSSGPGPCDLARDVSDCCAVHAWGRTKGFHSPAASESLRFHCRSAFRRDWLPAPIDPPHRRPGAGRDPVPWLWLRFVHRCAAHSGSKAKLSLAFDERVTPILL